MILQHINDIASICAGHGVKTAVISPGSRSAPLTLAFSRHPEIECKVIPDERSAAFIGAGIAQQQRTPVALICTSGSAAYNYAPAIAEAFYQEIPLLVLTADRPPEWTNQYDGQTIQQTGIYGKHVKASFDFPVGSNHEDALWHCNRIVNEALLESMSEPKGPVHINVPFREPFYPGKEQKMTFPEVRIIKRSKSVLGLPQSVWDELASEWKQHESKAIVVGQCDFSSNLRGLLKQFGEDIKVPIITDIISNQQNSESIKHQDAFLNPQLDSINSRLAPELLITFGKSLISKNLKTFLRKNSPKAHWHISESDRSNDTLQHTTRHIRMSPEGFFSTFKPEATNTDFTSQWLQKDQTTANSISEFFHHSEFGEFKAVQACLDTLPNQSQLHLANSMAVRYANLLGLPSEKNISVFANRGTSGIDGSNSTAVGASLSQDQIVTLITGDMAFFYDRNAFWHNYNLKNLRIIILNNHAGGIFRLIKGPSSQPELKEYFETRQELTTENACRDFKFDYKKVNSETDFKEALSTFYQASENACVLEVETSSEDNADIFVKFKQHIIDHL